jgi:hypothetical protein
MTDDPTRTEPAYFGTPEQLLNARDTKEGGK